jgi:hypothetical protein
MNLGSKFIPWLFCAAAFFGKSSFINNFKQVGMFDGIFRFLPETHPHFEAD